MLSREIDMTLFRKTGVMLFAALLTAISMTGWDSNTIAFAASKTFDGQLSELRAGPPSQVQGYTDHALQRMGERGITKDQVEFTVFLTYADAQRQANDTWMYRDPSGLIVIMNDNAFVVTTYYAGSNSRD
jgi:hypothetical protein